MPTLVTASFDALMHGFTTIRDLGTEGAAYADVELKQAVNQNIIPGPRMLVSTRAIVATGSYAPKARVRWSSTRKSGPPRSAVTAPTGGSVAAGDRFVVKELGEAPDPVRQPSCPDRHPLISVV